MCFIREASPYACENLLRKALQLCLMVAGAMDSSGQLAIQNLMSLARIAVGLADPRISGERPLPGPDGRAPHAVHW